MLIKYSINKDLSKFEKLLTKSLRKWGSKMQKRITSFMVSLVLVVGLLMPIGDISKVYAASEKLEQALQWAISIANDNRHGYSQSNRWGNPDYDCSSFVISALKAAGYDVGGATYTQNMRSSLTPRGFTWIPWSQIGGEVNLRRGDILLNDSSNTSKQHTEFYLGNGKNVGAHQNYGYPAAGDQTGKEISVSGYYNHPWTGVLRENGSVSDTCNCSTDFAGNYIVTTNQYPLTMRSGHGTGYAQIIAIPRGEQVYVSKADGTWAHVEWNGYKGYCSMQYLTKVQSVSAPTIHAWMSDTGMGSSPSIYRTGKSYYLCYELTDPQTGKRFNEVADANYTVTETIYKPDGSVAFSHSYDNSDNNWISHTPNEAGTYRGKVAISGDYIGDVEVSFEVKQHVASLHGWFSDNKMGEEVQECQKGTMYYLCYRIIDKETGELSSDFDDSDYSITETIYKPDGSIGHTYTYQNKKDNWIGYRFDQEGTYKGVITFTLGDYTAELKTESVVGHSHKYISNITKEPSCTQEGRKTYQCVCGESYIESIEKTGHFWDDGPITKAPTAKEQGTRTYTCHSCGEVRMEQIPATGQKDDNMDEDNTDQDSDDDTDQDSNNNMGKEEPEILEVGDLVEDSSGAATYEVISVNGTAVCVEYVESENAKDTTIKIPAKIITEGGVICKVTSISRGAFQNNRRVKKIVVGSNVKVIGDKAFYGCKNLSTVSLCKNVSTIGLGAFGGCVKLKNLTLPSKVAQIGSNAFYGCRQLKKLQIKTTKLTAKKLGKKAFRGLSIKTVIQVPKSKLRIYKNLFRQRGLSSRNKVR